MMAEIVIRGGETKRRLGRETRARKKNRKSEMESQIVG